MSRPYRGGTSYTRPENALKRAEELEKVGQKENALNILHETMTAKKSQATWSKQYADIMVKLLDLAVELKKKNIAKESLMRYRNLSHSVNIQSLEEVITHFLDRATEKTKDAQEKAASVAILNIEDLEEDARPEDLMLSYVSGDKSKDRTDREMVTPWFRFLWESYRSVLEILRTNPKLEKLYAMTANRAFDFCLKYKRTSEFRKLCEILRTNLVTITNKLREQLPIPEGAMQYHLECRYEQMRVACELELWGEAFKSVDDIQHLRQMFKIGPKPKDTIAYYQRLTQMFAISNSSLYHAFSWLRLYWVVISQVKSLPVEDKVPVPQQDISNMAACVLLSFLSILPYERKQSLTSSSAEDKSFMGQSLQLQSERDRLIRLANYLGIPVNVKTNVRQVLSMTSLQKRIAQYNVLAQVPKEVHDIYDLLSPQDFNPLDLCSKLHPLLQSLEKLSESSEGSYCGRAMAFSRYLESLKKVSILRTLKQLSEAYSCLSVERVSAIIPFATPAQIESLIVEAVKNGFLEVQVDHRDNVLYFGSKQQFSDAGNELEAVYAKLASMSKRLSEFQTTILATTPSAAAASGAEKTLESLLESHNMAVDVSREKSEAEHLSMLSRRKHIEERKEAYEKELQRFEQDREERKKKASLDAERAETIRRHEEEKRRLEERINREKEEMDQKAIAQLSAQMKNKKSKDGEKVNIQTLKETVISEQEKQREESERRLLKIGKQMDHLERARREAEAVLIEAAWKAHVEKMKALWEADQAADDKRLRLAWEDDLKEAERLLPLQADRELFAASIMNKRKEQFNALKREHEELLRIAYEERHNECERERRHVYVERCKKKVADHVEHLRAEQKKKEEERQRELDRIEEEKRKAKEAELRRQQEEEAAAIAAAEKAAAATAAAAAAPVVAPSDNETAAPSAPKKFIPSALRSRPAESQSSKPSPAPAPASASAYNNSWSNSRYRGGENTSSYGRPNGAPQAYEPSKGRVASSKE
uniref:PCI domain-containing protein n=1 Tax=Polytomella parva TaxID=51329 RepID=A0A7S0YIT4_9CHLO|mmetsp:Transcript_28918/g.53130  ORF Transcript_28918/g.53130 Transcript_28918/m.53130 type:complete len:994 (+) Transcript_28918:40-3021(+)|eukprot:CAMPEP_0175059544 /NCGR_PEP_ID=MMETSP0052_2-20121109/12491_1 /TAXON_ID=51329 ORGANISM="Polytomella parva, Strain SAG 63-3" /NCGR_SAMPLE_ID=MMETSP0052_2 /ASSEMBLY_ACC=CAM_ASM_000194 /LENGTH=993 /DNA_ID=CAMNT_0016325105 /DNA_START=29 /DNA_END=3010 /DNA_ORIENTATION=+